MQSQLHSSSLDGVPALPLSPESVTSPEVDVEFEDGVPTPESLLPPLAPVYTPAAAAGSRGSSTTPPEVLYLHNICKAYWRLLGRLAACDTSSEGLMNMFCCSCSNSSL
jgi:hypothetical protein